MWKTIISVITVFAMSLCVASCSDDEGLGFDSASKKYETDGITFTANGGSVPLTFLHPEGEKLELETLSSGGDSNWITIAATPESKKTRIVVGAAKNNTGVVRRGGVVVRLNGSVWSVSVVQSAE